MAMMPSAMGMRLGWQEPPLPSYLDLDKGATSSTPQSLCLKNEGPQFCCGSEECAHASEQSERRSEQSASHSQVGRAQNKGSP